MALAPGELRLTIEYAQGLKDEDWFARQDPYAVVTIGGQSFRTNVASDGGTSPVFNETFTFNVLEDNNFSIELRDDKPLHDPVLGHASGELSRVRATMSDHQQLAVRSTRSGEQHGFISVSLAFTPSGMGQYGGQGYGAPAAYGAPAYQQQQPGYGGYQQQQYEEQEYAPPPPHHHHGQRVVEYVQD